MAKYVIESAVVNKNDVVAGRTAAQIEAAKRKAVGGKRKRCTKGKSCSATCIASSKICLVDIPWVLAPEITKTRDEIQKRSIQTPTVKPPSKPQLSEKEIADAVMMAKYHAKAYEEYSKKKKQTDEVKQKLEYHRAKADEALNKLPDGETKAKTKDFVDGKLGRENLNNTRKAVSSNTNDAEFWYRAGSNEQGANYEKAARAAIAKLPESERAAATKALDTRISEAKQLYKQGKDEDQKLKDREPREILKSIRSKVKEMEDEYAKLNELKKNKDNLPSGELDWRIKQAQENAQKAKDNAMKEVSYLPAGMKIKAAATINNREIAAKTPVMTPKERKDAILNLATEYKYAMLKGNDQEAAMFKAQARSLAENVTGADKKKIKLFLDKIFNELKPLDFGKRVESPTEIAKIGKETVDKFPELKAAASILRKHERIISTVQQRANTPGLSPQEKEKVTKQWLKANNLRHKAELKMAKAMAQLRGEMLETSLTKAQVQEALDRINFVKGPGIAQARKDITEFLRMFNGRGFTNVEGSFGKPLESVTVTKERANANILLGRINVNANKATIFHEVAHLVEGQRAWMGSFASNWRMDKAFNSQQAADKGLSGMVEMQGTKPVFKLNNLIGPGFRDDEVAFADTYMHPYMGKIYSGQFQKTTSEVWSMTLEQFSSVSNMVTLYRAHPDMFEMGVGLAKS